VGRGSGHHALVIKSWYTPWVRIYNSEPMFQPGPNQRLPAFAPNISTKTLWGTGIP